MIIEQRTYNIVPGKVPEYLELYRKFGIEVQLRHLGCLLGYYHTEFGELNQIIHLWRYENLDDRSRRRTSLFADPKWLDYFDRVIPLILKQRSTLLNPASYVSPQPASVTTGS